MIDRPKPTIDDVPEPERMTPARLARRLHTIGLRLAKAQFELRSLAPYLDRAPIDLPHDMIRTAACAVVDLGTAVRVGQVELVPDYLDPSCRPDRPLLDKIEAAPLNRAADEVAPAIAARPADGPGFEQQKCRVCGCTDETTGFPCTWIEDDLCGACHYEARDAGRSNGKTKGRTPGQGKPVDPTEWTDAAKHDELAAALGSTVRPPPTHDAAGAARAAAKRRAATKSPRIAQDESTGDRPTDGATRQKGRQGRKGGPP